MKIVLVQVKVDAKTKTLLDEWRAKKKKASENGATKEEKETNGEADEKTDDADKGEEKEVLDEFTLREDRVAKAGLDAIMREYAFELAKEPSNAKQSTGKGEEFVLHAPC